MQWQYIVTFVGSLLVALISVWIAQRWSANREYRSTLNNLASEVSGNIKRCQFICEWLDKDLEVQKDGYDLVSPYPHLYDSAWISVKGIIAVRDYPICAQLEDAYLWISVVNAMMFRLEELKWGVARTLMHSDTVKVETLKRIRIHTTNRMLPSLEDARTLLEQRLKKPSDRSAQ